MAGQRRWTSAPLARQDFAGKPMVAGSEPVNRKGPFILGAGLVFAVDLVTKVLAERLLAPEQLVFNTGAAFGLLAGWRWPLAGAGVFVVWILAEALRRQALNATGRWGAMLVVGGAAGNTLDRLLRGAVVDFLSLPGYPFQFNLADIALRLGGVLLFLDLVRPVDAIRRMDRSPPEPRRTPET